jgi:hypothetical protein
VGPDALEHVRLALEGAGGDALAVQHLDRDGSAGGVDALPNGAESSLAEHPAQPEA